LKTVLQKCGDKIMKTCFSAHADGVDIKETNLSTDTDVAPMGLKETVLCKSSDRHDDDAVKHRDGNRA